MHPLGPPGHRPGFHIPGTLVPIGAVMEQQAAAQAEMEAQARARTHKRARNLLLLLR